MFGRGQFSGNLHVLSSPGGASLLLLDRLARIRRSLEVHPVIRIEYLPYELFTPGRGGLIQWGDSESGDTFYWLADSRDPGRWPVLAQPDSGGWSRFDMTMSEFLFHLLTDDEIEDFTVADIVDPPYFEPY